MRPRPRATGSRARTYVVVAALALLPCAAAGSQERNPVVFRSDVRLVVTQAVVFSRDRQPVVDLTVDDFRITENGQERRISVFLPPDSGPIEIAVVIDSSGSMIRWPTKEATAALLDSLHPRSCVLMIPFDDQVRAGVWGHPDDPAVRDVVSRLALHGKTSLFDALLSAYQLMRERVATDGAPSAINGPSFAGLLRFRVPGVLSNVTPAPTGRCAVGDETVPPDASSGVRRAVVVVTDGQDNTSLATVEDVLLSSWGSGLPLFAFAITDRPREGSLDWRGSPMRVGHVRALERVVRHTGGFVIREMIERSAEQPFWDGFERLGAALRGHYVLGFIPQGGPGDAELIDRRKIKVTVGGSGFDVMTPSELELGRGASEGAAFDLALRGFQEFAAGDASAALTTFDIAAAIGPRLGLVHFGRGAALAVTDRWSEAVAALRLTKELAPWIPDLDARIAEALLHLEDVEQAWAAALLAYRSGSEIGPLLERLQEIAPRDIDFARLPHGRRIALKMRQVTAPYGAVAGGPLLRELGNALADSEALGLAHVGQHVGVVLLVDIAKVEVHGRRVSIQGWLLLQNQAGEDLVDSVGERLMRRRFRIDDLESVATLRSEAVAVVRELESAMARQQQASREPGTALSS